MADFTRPLNFIRSTLSRAGKFAESPGAQRAMHIGRRISRETTRSPAKMTAIAASSLAGGVVNSYREGKGHRIKGFAQGVALAGVTQMSVAAASTYTGRAAMRSVGKMGTRAGMRMAAKSGLRW